MQTEALWSGRSTGSLIIAADWLIGCGSRLGRGGKKVSPNRSATGLHRLGRFHSRLHCVTKGLLGEDHRTGHVGRQFLLKLRVELVAQSTGGDTVQK